MALDDTDIADAEGNLRPELARELRPRPRRQAAPRRAPDPGSPLGGFVLAALVALVGAAVAGAGTRPPVGERLQAPRRDALGQQRPVAPRAPRPRALPPRREIVRSDRHPIRLLWVTAAGVALLVLGVLLGRAMRPSSPARMIPEVTELFPPASAVQPNMPSADAGWLPSPPRAQAVTASEELPAPTSPAYAFNTARSRRATRPRPSTPQLPPDNDVLAAQSVLEPDVPTLKRETQTSPPRQTEARRRLRPPQSPRSFNTDYPERRPVVVEQAPLGFYVASPGLEPFRSARSARAPLPPGVMRMVSVPMGPTAPFIVVAPGMPLPLSAHPGVVRPVYQLPRRW